MRETRSSRAFTIVECLIALCLLGMLLAICIQLFSHARIVTQKLTPQLSVQQGSRKALVRVIEELQESMEVLVPQPGSTLYYALVRDKVGLLRMYYLVPRKPDSTALGSKMYELWRDIADPKLPPQGGRACLVQNISRLTFTSRSAGSLQINLTLSEQGEKSSLLTSVRLRNLPSAEELW